MATTLEVNSIITADPAFIVRDEVLNEATVTAYAEEPERLPAIEVWRDPDTEQVYLLDGQHRLAAHRQRALAEISVVYFEGSRAEAEARARVANLQHGLALSGPERRRARLEVVERLYEYSNNWIAEDFLRCSSNTVAALRSSLEEAGRIPKLDRLKRKGGGNTPRSYDENGDAADEAPDDGLFGSERNIKPPADLLEPEEEPDNHDGGYNAGGDDEEDDGESSGGLPSDRPAKTDAGAGFSPSDGTVRKGGKGGQTTLKLAQVGEPLAVEVVLYVDGDAHSIPVTLLMAEGSIAGAPETTPDHPHVLAISADLGRAMGLLFD